jgi:hypothetical protein
MKEMNAKRKGALIDSADSPTFMNRYKGSKI